MFTYADIVRRLDALERSIADLRKLVEASACVPPRLVDQQRPTIWRCMRWGCPGHDAPQGRCGDMGTDVRGTVMTDP